MIANHEMNCNMFPPCFGNYQAGCAFYSGCDRAKRMECLMVAQLEESRQARREREKRDRRRRGELGSVGYHHARLGYAMSDCRAADTDWRADL